MIELDEVSAGAKLTSCAHDEVRISWALRALSPVAATRNEIAAAESEATAALVKDCWTLVRRVAERLFQQGTLDGEVVRSLVDDSEADNWDRRQAEVDRSLGLTTRIRKREEPAVSLRTRVLIRRA